jgi:8-oxo-dGTP pyrophosphatase MutT (NUDIX family)
LSKGNYYQLPGGGIEDDEELCVAGVREVMEESGCRVEIEGDQ